ncbi:hypothetical protein EON65_54975 [archaeon]|nr:MAG: hypothetical protein EON65_54975 [archaeon]
MNISVKSSSSTLTLNVEPDETIFNVKLKIQSRVGIPPSQQRLFHDNKQLADAVFLSAYGIKDSTFCSCIPSQKTLTNK